MEHQASDAILKDIDQQQGVINTFLEMLRTLIPVVDKIKSTIEESSNAIPRASSQLNNVTEATESATVEILNVLDQMSKRIDTAESELQTVETWMQQHRNGTEPPSASTDAIRAALKTTRDDSMNIAMALQVQDITSQQLAGVSHMIHEVRSQLNWALRKFDNRYATEPPVQAAPPESGKSFDMHAQYSKSADKQGAADEIIMQWASNNVGK